MPGTSRSLVRLFVALIAVPTAVLVVGGAHEAATTHAGRYVAHNGPLAIWCDSEPHDLPDPDDSIHDYCGSCPYKWIFMANPECYGSDAINAVEASAGGERSEWGYGGFAFRIEPEDLGGTMTVWTVDDLFAGSGWLRALPTDD